MGSTAGIQTGNLPGSSGCNRAPSTGSGTGRDLVRSPVSLRFYIAYPNPVNTIPCISIRKEETDLYPPAPISCARGKNAPAPILQQQHRAGFIFILRDYFLPDKLRSILRNSSPIGLNSAPFSWMSVRSQAISVASKGMQTIFPEIIPCATRLVEIHTVLGFSSMTENCIKAS